MFIEYLSMNILKEIKKNKTLQNCTFLMKVKN